MKTIGYVIPCFPTLSETFTGVEMRAMIALGHHVVPFSFIKGQHFQRADIPLMKQCSYPSNLPYYSFRHITRSVRSLPFIYQQHEFGKLALLRQGLQLALWAHRYQCRHLHAHFAWHSAAIAIVAAKILNIPVSFVGHGADIYAGPQDLQAKLSHCQFCCAVTKAMHDHLQSLTKTPVHYLPCGIEEQNYPTLNNDWSPSKRFLFIGRLVEKKGLITLLKAVQLLKHPIEIDLVGDGPLKAELMSFCKQHGLINAVSFLGSQNADWLRSHAERYQGLIAPFTIAKNGDTDTGPLVLKEALALGIPIITTNLVGCTEILCPDIGVMIKKDSPKELATAITNHQRKSHQELKIQRELGYRHVMKTFTAKAQAQRLSQWIEAL
ncbi:glycosyltransferase family 4 protein [Photobacterium angustum]|uniref:Colanic acid biosynthesis glycosyltransferase WcaL n=1 Tax=Photobacterium angustum TaxID=661 RepID=A0A2S7W2D2_PHOAN|nr:glycosyltransferase [Photobacterium angustum]PQJ68014.1 colanic acid biosynthesis glycosyltransferase WcaL [Photobacterium angustum]